MCQSTIQNAVDAMLAAQGKYNSATTDPEIAKRPEMDAKWLFEAGYGFGIHKLTVCDAFEDAERVIDPCCTVRVSGKTGEVWIRNFTRAGIKNQDDIKCADLADAKRRVEYEAAVYYGMSWDEATAALPTPPAATPAIPAPLAATPGADEEATPEA